MKRHGEMLWGWFVCRAAPAVYGFAVSAWRRGVPVGLALWGWFVCRAAPAAHAFVMAARRRAVPWGWWLLGWGICRLAPWTHHTAGILLRNLNEVSLRVKIPTGFKILSAGALAVVGILGIGFAFGHSTGPTGPAGEPIVQQQQQHAAAPAPQLPQAQQLPPPPPPTPDSLSIPAQLAPPQQIPLAWRNPVVGPNRPPLPEEDADGPYGSRRTTGTYEVALTFDDGPDPQWTPRVLQSLRENQIKATFCLIGVNVVEFPELVRDIAADGHTLCNHSWAHDTGLGNRSYSTILADMSRTNEAIRAAAPRARISYFRHPGGMWTAAAVAAAKSLGMTSLHWEVDPKDWLKPGARAISSTVIASAIPGAIVLLHDGGGDRRGTTEALSSILPNLRSRFPLVALPAGIDPPRRHGIQLPIHLGQQ